MGLDGVAALAGDGVPDAAPWVGYVAAVARDEVDVQVEDGLACGFADVDADVEGLGSNQVRTCLRGTISRWPSLTGKASQRALVSRSSKAIRSWVGEKGQAAAVVIALPTCASAS